MYLTAELKTATDRDKWRSLIEVVKGLNGLWSKKKYMYLCLCILNVCNFYIYIFQIYVLNT